jgi:hypothetical protein
MANRVKINSRQRSLRLVKNAISTFNLDLGGLVVLTEAASGYYVLTPLIAAMAKAKQVFALAQDSHYGSAEEIARGTMALAEEWGVADRIQVLFSREDSSIREADIVTNLGFVRPLDRQFLRRLNPYAVVPLMYETWEFREQDVDLEECRNLNIPVLGTNESHKDLQIFRYVGNLAVKLLLLLDVEVFRSTVIVLGSGIFVQEINSAAGLMGADIRFVEVDRHGHFDTAALRQYLPDADALIVAEHHSRDLLIGESASFTPSELFALNPDLSIVHICGSVDFDGLTRMKFRCYPDTFAPPGYMSITTAFLGPRPLIDLHAAGLKVGEDMARARGECISAAETEQRVLADNSLAQAFQSSLLGTNT